MKNADVPEAVDCDESSRNQEEEEAMNQEEEEAINRKEEKGTTTELSSIKAVSSPFGYRKGHFMRWRDVRMVALSSSGGGDMSNSYSGHSSSHGGGAGDTTNAASSSDAPPKQYERVILNNVSGAAPSSQVTAILGPSGSGKTSLLNVLSGRAASIRNKLIVTSESLLFDSTLVDPASDITVRQRIAFCAQDDSLPVTATPREAILFSARLRLPKTVSEEDLVQLTENMLDELHLQDCSDVMVGGTLVKGLSGGERKRTSVGVELVVKPAMVFLDEPTSGLDSFNALELCQVFQKVAKAGSAVLMTIHQPASEIFTDLIDRLILLKKGNVMYSGSVKGVVDYFAERGYPCPAHHNPADFILNVAQSQTVDKLKSEGFFSGLDKDIEELDRSSAEDMENSDSVHSLSLVPEKERVGLKVQVQQLFKREIQNVVRNKKALQARTGMTVMISTLGGIIFFQVADSDFTNFINVQTTFGALLVSLLANVFSTALPSLVAFPEERPVFIREYSTNHYSVTAYFLSRFTMELLVTAAQVTISTVLTYFLVQFYGDYGTFWICLYTLAMTSTALGVLLGCSVKDPDVAVEMLPLIFMPQILFAGFFTPPDLIPVWLRWISYIFPLTYATRIALVNEFDGACEGLDSPQNFCQTVLSNTNSDPDEVWWYWIILVTQCVWFRLLGLFILRKKAASFY